MRVWIAFGILVVIIFVVQFAGAILSGGSCPKNIYGANSENKIKYFSSPLCIACWAQKPIINRMAADNGDKFLMEEYDVDLCRESAAPHYIRGIPAFIVNGTVIYGLQSEEALKGMIA